MPIVLLLAQRVLLVFQSSATENFSGRSRLGQCSELCQCSFGRGAGAAAVAAEVQRARLACLPSACTQCIKQIMSCNAGV